MFYCYKTFRPPPNSHNDSHYMNEVNNFTPPFNLNLITEIPS